MTSDAATMAPKTVQPEARLTGGTHEPLLRFFRVLALVGAGTILTFAWIHRVAEPDAVDPLGVRLVLVAICLAIFAATWYVRLRTVVRLAHATFYLVTLWVLWLLLANDLSGNYALALIVTAAGIAGAFSDRRLLLQYQLATLAGLGIVVLLVSEPRSSLVVFLPYAVVMAVLSFLAVNVRVELDRRHVKSEERYALAAYGANDGLWDWDLLTGTIFYSARWKTMLGLAEHDIGADPAEWFSRIHPEDVDRARKAMTPGLSGRTHLSAEYRIRHRNGEWRWMLARGAVVRDRAGRPIRLAGSQADITERRHAEAQILHDALHDPLTGLPNRALVVDRLERLLTASRRHGDGRFAVLFVDLDRFKRINDSLGHASGDRFLLEAARRLRGQLRDEDTLARVGGDEFVVVLPRVRDADHALRVAERIRAAVAEPQELGGAPVYVTASIGIALGPGAYEGPEALLRDADIAMYRCKKERLDRPQLFDEAMHRLAVGQLHLEAQLRHALERNELVLHYQPIVLLETNLVDGLEALVRWQHPERGLLPPADFISLAEETGLIVELGRWALGEAARAHARWNRTLGVAPVVHVNLSGAHFQAGSVLEDVAEAMKGAGAGSRLAIEITENVLLTDPAAAATVLMELRGRGVGVAIDDFGTGYSSLRYLHSLPADVLKIDRSFVQRAHEAGGGELIRTIVLLADRLGLSTVAEGIEQADVAEQIRASGATHGQGFLFGPPMTEADAALVLSTGTPLPA